MLSSSWQSDSCSHRLIVFPNTSLEEDSFLLVLLLLLTVHCQSLSKDQSISHLLLLLLLSYHRLLYYIFSCHLQYIILRAFQKIVGGALSMLSINSDTGVIGFIFKSFHAMSPASIAKSLTASMLSASIIPMIKCSGSKWSNGSTFTPYFCDTDGICFHPATATSRDACLLTDRYLVDESLLVHIFFLLLI